MRVLLRTAVTVSVLCLPTSGTAQQLHVRSTKIIADLPHFLVLPLHCDSQQNVFVWGANPSGGRLPVLELDVDGKELHRFDISAAKQDGIERASVQTYAVTPDGSLYELVALPSGKVAVIHFKPTGEYAGVVYLDRSFSTVHLAVFSTGEFFVDGTIAAGKRYAPAFHGNLRSNGPAPYRNTERRAATYFVGTRSAKTRRECPRPRSRSLPRLGRRVRSEHSRIRK
jgi:hypothetical protein